MIYALVAAVLLIYSGVSAKERVRVKKDKFKFKEIFPIVSKNKALLILSLAMFLNTSVWVVGNAVGVYYFKYVWKMKVCIPFSGNGCSQQIF